MQYTTLGRTGLRVGVAGLGCGGNSRIGLGAGLSTAQSVALVREALDLGVNLIDTAEAYGTEEIVGEAIRGRTREGVVVSTKSFIGSPAAPRTAAEMVASLEGSLRRLGTDCVDIFHLHGVPPALYDYSVAELVPALLREKEKGKLRHLAVSETAPRDPGHEMLHRAVDEPAFEVVMLAFHMLNQNARPVVLKRTQEERTGTLCMFAVRNIFSRPGLLQQTMAGLVADGSLPASVAAGGNPLGFLMHENGADSLIDAAYRYARHEPGINVVLFGTSSVDHLRTNVASILRPPLPEPDVARLNATFGHLVGVGLDLPDRVQAKS